MENVKTRKIRIARKKFDEKFDHEMSPYGIAGEIKNMSNDMFLYKNFSEKGLQASLRDRFTLLLTNFGILRAESLFLCELSDLCSLELENQGVHKCMILMLRIATGKTNGLKKLWASNEA